MLRILATFFADLRGLVSETARAMIVRRFCRLMVSSLAGGHRKLWIERDQTRFILETGISDVVPKIPDVSVGAVDIWANKWLHVDKFRVKGGESAVWRPITPEQNALRVTMIHDLRNLVEKDLTNAKTDGSIVVEDD